jgi:hypothetical protein
MWQGGTFFKYPDEYVGGHCNPDLRFHRVLALAEETLDSQMLLDPFEEQLELSALAIECRDQRRAEREIVGQKHQALAGLGLSHHDATQYCGAVGLRVEPGEHTGPIAQDVRGYPIHGVRFSEPLPECLRISYARRSKCTTQWRSSSRPSIQETCSVNGRAPCSARHASARKTPIELSTKSLNSMVCVYRE